MAVLKKQNKNVSPVARPASHLAAHLGSRGVLLKLGQQLSCHEAHLVLPRLPILASGGSTVTRQLVPGEEKSVIKENHRAKWDF